MPASIKLARSTSIARAVPFHRLHADDLACIVQHLDPAWRYSFARSCRAAHAAVVATAAPDCLVVAMARAAVRGVPLLAYARTLGGDDADDLVKAMLAKLNGTTRVLTKTPYAVAASSVAAVEWALGDGAVCRGALSRAAVASVPLNLEVLEHLRLRRGFHVRDARSTGRRGAELRDVCVAAARDGDFDALAWAREHGGARSVEACCAAAARGHVHVLGWLRLCGLEWDATVCAAAAGAGEQLTLEWLRARDCPWDESTCAAAAAGGHLAVLTWAHDRVCPLPSTLCELAAKYGHLSVLQWARARGCPWSASPETSAMCMAAGGGHREIVHWLYEHDCPWHARVAAFVAEGGDAYDLMVWMWMRGCIVDQEAFIAAARLGRERLLIFFKVTVGLPWTARAAMTMAAGGHLELLQWAHRENGPWDERVCEAAAGCGHLYMLQWARERGCPWNRRTYEGPSTTTTYRGSRKISASGTMSPPRQSPRTEFAKAVSKALQPHIGSPHALRRSRNMEAALVRANIDHRRRVNHFMALTAAPRAPRTPQTVARNFAKRLIPGRRQPAGSTRLPLSNNARKAVSNGRWRALQENASLLYPNDMRRPIVNSLVESTNRMKRLQYMIENHEYRNLRTPTPPATPARSPAATPPRLRRRLPAWVMDPPHAIAKRLMGRCDAPTLLAFLFLFARYVHQSQPRRNRAPAIRLLGAPPPLGWNATPFAFANTVNTRTSPDDVVAVASHMLLMSRARVGAAHARELFVATVKAARALPSVEAIEALVAKHLVEIRIGLSGAAFVAFVVLLTKRFDRRRRATGATAR